MPPGNDGQPRVLISCIYYLVYKSPAVQDAFRAYEWRELGQLQLAYPNGISVALRHAVDALSSGIRAAKKEIYDEQKRRAENRRGNNR